MCVYVFMHAPYLPSQNLAAFSWHCNACVCICMSMHMCMCMDQMSPILYVCMHRITLHRLVHSCTCMHMHAHFFRNRKPVKHAANTHIHVVCSHQHYKCHIHAYLGASLETQHHTRRTAFGNYHAPTDVCMYVCVHVCIHVCLNHTK